MPYRPTAKTEAKKAAMRASLMAAACKLFSEQGYEATTLQQIVKEARTSIGNCYFYFPNKEAILLAVAADLRQEVTQIIDHAIEQLPLGPGLLAVALYVGTLAVLERPQTARFALSDGAHPSLRPLTMSLFTARVEDALVAMPGLFADWPDANPQMAAAAWHGASSHVLEGYVTGRIKDQPEQLARFLARWNLQAIGLSPQLVQDCMNKLDQFIDTHV